MRPLKVLIPLIAIILAFFLVKWFVGLATQAYYAETYGKARAAAIANMYSYPNVDPYYNERIRSISRSVGAIRANDSGLCAIDNDSIDKTCISYLERFRSMPESPPDEKGKDYSLPDGKINVTGLCGLISNTGARTVCLERALWNDQLSLGSNSIESLKLYGDPGVCSGYPAPKNRDSCLSAIGIMFLNTTICDSIMDPLSRTYCITEIGKYAGRTELCKTQQCMEEAIYTLAKKTKDISLCDNLTSRTPYPAEACYSYLATILLNHTACDLLHYETGRDICYASVGSNPKSYNSSLCRLIIDPGKKDECYFSIGAGMKDAAACNAIQNQHRRENCQLYLHP